MRNMIIWRPPQIPSSGGGTVYPADPLASPGHEDIAARRWLYNKMTQSTAVATALGGSVGGTLPIYESLIPQGTALPAIVIAPQSPGIEGNAKGNAIAGVPLFSVKVVTEGHTFGPADTIIKTVFPLLEGASGTVTGFSILGCNRVSNLDYIEVRDGKRYNHLGAVYRIAVVGTA